LFLSEAPIRGGEAKTSGQPDELKATGILQRRSNNNTFDETEQSKDDLSCENILRIPVLALVSNQCPIVVQHTDSVAHVLKVLQDNKILSAPVYSSETDRFIALVDVLDLVVFLVSLSQGTDTSMEQIRRGFQRPVYQACGISRNNPFYPIAECTTVHEALENFLALGVHRLPIVDSCNRIRALVCQLDAICFLLRVEGQTPEITKVFNLSLRALGLACKQTLVTVPADEALISCFALLALNKISGLAIVDKTGRLVGSLCAMDLAGITEENWLDLSMSVGDFVYSKVRQQSAIFCKPEHTLRQMLQMATTGKVHRVFVVDDDLKPVGVVTFTDALRVVVRHQ